MDNRHSLVGARWEAHPRREIVDGIRYPVDNGIKWSSMPADFPPSLWNQRCQAVCLWITPR